jgi:hypothetical protein
MLLREFLELNPKGWPVRTGYIEDETFGSFIIKREPYVIDNKRYEDVIRFRTLPIGGQFDSVLEFLEENYSDRIVLFEEINNSLFQKRFKKLGFIQVNKECGMNFAKNIGKQEGVDV